MARGDLGDQPRRAPPEGDERDAEIVQLAEILVRGELGVEDEVARALTCPRLPELDEPQHFLALLPLAEVGVGIAEHLAVRILREEGQDGLPALAATRDVVLLDKRVLPKVRDGVEVEIERAGVDPLRLSEAGHPAAQEAHDAAAPQPRGVLPQEGGLGEGIEAGRERHAFVEDEVHHVTAASLADQLEQERRADRMGGRNHLRAGELRVVDHPLKIQPCQQGQQQKQPAEARRELPVGQRKGPRIGDGIGERPRAGRPLGVEAPRQPGEALLAKYFLDGGGTEAVPPGALQRVPNVVDGEVLFA